MKGRYFFYIPILLCTIYLGYINIGKEAKHIILGCASGLLIISTFFSMIGLVIWYASKEDSTSLHMMGPDRTYKEYVQAFMGTGIKWYIIFPLSALTPSLYCFNRWLDKTFSTGKYKNKNK